MNQMIEKLVTDVSQLGSCYADLADFVSCIDSKGGAAIMAATPYVILGSISIWICVRRCRRSKPERGHVLTRSWTLAELHGGELALHRFLSYNEARVNPKTLDNVELLLEALLKQEHLDFKYLQKNTVTKLEMSAKEETAIEILTKAKKAHGDKPHEAYEIEMLLVEMLIYKGDYQQAFKCECLEDEDIFDARRPFYKAILHVALDQPKEAEICWEEFVDMRRQFRDIIKTTPSLLNGAYDTIIDFPQFNKKAKELVSYISDVSKKKAKK